MAKKQLAKRSVVPAHPPSLSGSDVVQSWLDGRSEGTKQGYLCDLKWFALWAGANSPAAAVEWLVALGHGEANRQVRAFLGEMKDGRLLNRDGTRFSSAAINRRIAALRSMTKVARMIGVINWQLEVEVLRVEAKKDNRGPDLVDVRMMQRAANRKGPGKEARLVRAILALLHDLVLRRNSLRMLDLVDVELAPDGRPVAIRVVAKGKREKVRMSLPPSTARAIAEWLAVRGGHDGPLLHGFDRYRRPGTRLSGERIRQIVSQLGYAAGIRRPVRPHGLRHSGITTAMDVGVKPADVQQLSGHASLDMVMRYYDRRREVAGEVAAKLAALRDETE
jgi:integrase/recombinase XerC